MYQQTWRTEGEMRKWLISEERSETMEAKIRETRNVRDRARSLAFLVHTFPMTNLNSSSSPPLASPIREISVSLSLSSSFVLSYSPSTSSALPLRASPKPQEQSWINASKGFICVRDRRVRRWKRRKKRGEKGKRDVELSGVN